MALRESEQAAYTIVIFVLVAYIVLFCKHDRLQFEEGFDTTFDKVPQAVSFVVSSADGAINAVTSASVATPLRQQIDAAALAMYNNAMNDSSAAARPLLSAQGQRLSDMTSNVNNQALLINSYHPSQVADLQNNSVVKTKTWQIMSMRNKPPAGFVAGYKNTSNCLDSGSNWQPCNWDNAHRRFQIQDTPYKVNDWYSIDGG